jgi:hypothetical protein
MGRNGLGLASRVCELNSVISLGDVFQHVRRKQWCFLGSLPL